MKVAFAIYLRKRPKICPKIEKPQALTNIEAWWARGRGSPGDALSALKKDVKGMALGPRASQGRHHREV